MRRENIILPLRRDMPRLQRLHQAVERLAGLCSWRCPIAAFLLILSAHVFSTPTWWQMICDVLVAILIALLFCSYGFTIALGAVLVERPHRRFESVGRLLGVFGGVVLAALGVIGAWALVRSAIIGL